MKLFSQDILNDLTAKAAASPRRRAHLNIHAAPTDPVQRFFIATQKDTYFRPHRHTTRSELGVVLRGYFDILTFDESGGVTGRYRVGSDTANLAFETPQNTWHTLLAGTDGAAFLEIKEGPYDPATAAEFAAWAPAEGHESVASFQHWLRDAQPGAAAFQPK
jgi:cupin fold WbuC family metalloprotein